MFFVSLRVVAFLQNVRNHDVIVARNRFGTLKCQKKSLKEDPNPTSDHLQRHRDQDTIHMP
jgi:hypothetical protein